MYGQSARKPNPSIDDLHPYGKPRSKQKFKSGNLFTESQALQSFEPLIRDTEDRKSNK